MGITIDVSQDMCVCILGDSDRVVYVLVFGESVNVGERACCSFCNFRFHLFACLVSLVCLFLAAHGMEVRCRYPKQGRVRIASSNQLSMLHSCMIGAVCVVVLRPCEAGFEVSGKNSLMIGYRECRMNGAGVICG